MARDRNSGGTPPDSVISIIAPGMTIVGDCATDGTVRIEGTVQGSVRAGKAVVVGKEGVIDGDVSTQDAVVSGTVTGTIVAASRLEIQATAHVHGEVRAKRIQLEEGAILNGTVQMGETVSALSPPPAPKEAEVAPEQPGPVSEEAEAVAEGAVPGGGT